MERIRRWLKRTPTTANSPDRTGTPYRTAAATTTSRRCVVHAANLPPWTRWLGADDAAIYFTGGLSIYALPRAATVPTRLTDPRVHVSNAALGDSAIVWNARESVTDEVAALWCTSITGDSTRKLATASGSPSALVVRGGLAFWVTTRLEMDPTNDKVIEQCWSTIHVHDVTSGEIVAPSIERKAFLRGFSAVGDGVGWIETERSEPMRRCTRARNGELRVDSFGAPPSSLRHGPAVITERAAHLVALDRDVIETVDFADGTTTTFAKLTSPVLSLKADDASLYAITGRPARSRREVWSIDRESRVAERLAAYDADKWISSLYTSGDLGLVSGDVFVCGDSRILRIAAR